MDNNNIPIIDNRKTKIGCIAPNNRKQPSPFPLKNKKLYEPDYKKNISD